MKALVGGGGVLSRVVPHCCSIEGGGFCVPSWQKKGSKYETTAASLSGPNHFTPLLGPHLQKSMPERFSLQHTGPSVYIHSAAL